ncbi:MAG: MBL fold metallo-hydrolase, partial [Desulfurobacteriaceae bacterium]
GTSYNSYIIFGSEKTALIDTVEPHKGEELLRNLEELNVERIDYIISNHAEQDHSGMIPEVLKRFPEAKVVTNKKCKAMLIDLLDLKEEVFEVIEDRGTISLGDKTLQFFMSPWGHSPETM